MISSAGNAALGLVLARSLAPREFGAFSLVFALYLLALGATRALGSSVLLVRFGASPPSVRHQAVRDSAGMPLLVSAVASPLIFGLAELVHDELASGLRVLALVLPVLLVQDTWRVALLAVGRPRSAVANDALWTTTEVVFLAVIVRLDAVSVPWAVGVWGASAATGALLGCVQLRVAPLLRGTGAWLRRHRDLGPFTLGEFLLIAGTPPALVLGLTAVGGLREIAAFRAAELLIGPLTLASSAALFAALPEASRMWAERPQALPGALRLGGWAFAGGCATWGAAFLLVPTTVGEALVGANWTGARSVVLPLALNAAALGLSASWLLGLRVMESARRAFILRLVLAPATVGAGVVGMIVGDAASAATASAAVSAAGAWFTYRSFAQALDAELSGGRTPPDQLRKRST